MDGTCVFCAVCLFDLHFILNLAAKMSVLIIQCDCGTVLWFSALRATGIVNEPRNIGNTACNR